MLARPHGGTIVTISSVLGYLGCAGLGMLFLGMSEYVGWNVD